MTVWIGGSSHSALRMGSAAAPVPENCGGPMSGARRSGRGSEFSVTPHDWRTQAARRRCGCTLDHATGRQVGVVLAAWQDELATSGGGSSSFHGPTCAEEVDESSCGNHDARSSRGRVCDRTRVARQLALGLGKSGNDRRGIRGRRPGLRRSGHAGGGRAAWPPSAGLDGAAGRQSDGSSSAKRRAREGVSGLHDREGLHRDQVVRQAGEPSNAVRLVSETLRGGACR